MPVRARPLQYLRVLLWITSAGVACPHQLYNYMPKKGAPPVVIQPKHNPHIHTHTHTQGPWAVLHLQGGHPLPDSPPAVARERKKQLALWDGGRILRAALAILVKRPRKGKLLPASRCPRVNDDKHVLRQKWHSRELTKACLVFRTPLLRMRACSSFSWN